LNLGIFIEWYHKRILKPRKYAISFQQNRKNIIEFLSNKIFTSLFKFDWILYYRTWVFDFPELLRVSFSSKNRVKSKRNVIQISSLINTLRLMICRHDSRNLLHTYLTLLSLLSCWSGRVTIKNYLRILKQFSRFLKIILLWVHWVVKVW
jgi:prenyltransferase beta subunit